MCWYVGVPTSKPPPREKSFGVLEHCGAGLVDCGVVMIPCGSGQMVRSNVVMCRGLARPGASESALRDLLSGAAWNLARLRASESALHSLLSGGSWNLARLRASESALHSLFSGEALCVACAPVGNGPVCLVSLADSDVCGVFFVGGHQLYGSK
jgi:hypothetical protein